MICGHVSWACDPEGPGSQDGGAPRLSWDTQKQEITLCWLRPLRIGGFLMWQLVFVILLNAHLSCASQGIQCH